MISKEWVEAMLMIEPRPASIIPGRTVRAQCQTPSRSTDMQRRQSSSVIARGSPNTLMPALLTRMSGVPNAARVVSTIAATDAEFDDVGWNEQRARSRRREFGRHRRSRFVIDLGHDHARPLRRKAPRDCRPDALAGAGDDRSLAVQPSRHGSLIGSTAGCDLAAEAFAAPPREQDWKGGSATPLTIR